MEQRRTERRKVNQAVGEDKRGKAKDRRSCPQCGSAVLSHSEPFPGGSITRRYCNRCGWRALSRQLDEERLRLLAGSEAAVVGTAGKPLLELSASFLKAARLKVGDHIEIKPLYTPDAEQPLTWVMKKIK